MKKGFTLVEILSIIVVLGIITVIVFPSINENINSKKERELDKILGIVENAAKAYHTNNKNEYKISLDILKKENYITNDLKDPTTKEVLAGCVRVIKNDKKLEYKYGSCDNIFVKLNVELNGGTTSQEFNESYVEYDLITLENPTKVGAVFKEWTLIKAKWTAKTLTVIFNKNDGTNSTLTQTFTYGQSGNKFGYNTDKLYAYGGDGGAPTSTGGGSNGLTPNTGDGGQGSSHNNLEQKAGASGIVIIRNAR